MEPRSGLFQAVDRLAKGRLAERLLGLRDEGLSPDKIVSRIYAEFGVDISTRSVTSWLRKLTAARENRENNGDAGEAA